MHMTMRTSLAMKALMFCAMHPDQIVRRREIAEAVGASDNHLAQVVYLLGQHGYLTTIRGRSGGLKLARSADQITVGAVFRSFEKVLPFSDCMGTVTGTCPLQGACRLTCVLSEAVEIFYDRLDKTTLAALTVGNHALELRLKAA